MRPGEPSRTAFGAARHRAWHQELEGGRVFRDPLAWRILGETPDSLSREDAERRRPLRLFIAVRHRFAEDTVAAAVDRGVQQVVVLGAGLDTFAYRNPFDRLRVFEVDHPDTGAWKRERLAAAGVAVPSSVYYVGVDFERDSLLERLTASGFDDEAPATFLWLGVVPYLTPEAVRTTLAAVASVPGAEVVLDYPTRTPSADPRMRALRDDLHERTQRAGEPILTTLDPTEMRDWLQAAGFDEIEDLGVAEFAPRYLGHPAPDRPSGGGHVVRARRTTL